MITGYKYKSSEALSVHKVESFLYQNIELAMSWILTKELLKI
jgi:hypothetical protein